MEEQVYGIIEECITKFNKHFPETPFNSMVFVVWKVKGRVAGYAEIEGDRYTMNLNEYIYKNNPTALKSTTIHEMAHLLTEHKYGTMDHGHRWKWMMNLMGVNEPKRCHNYKSKSTRKVRKFEYKCDCSTHSCGIIIHNKMQKGYQTRTCASCDSTLKWTGEEIQCLKLQVFTMKICYRRRITP